MREIVRRWRDADKPALVGRSLRVIRWLDAMRVLGLVAVLILVGAVLFASLLRKNPVARGERAETAAVEAVPVAPALADARIDALERRLDELALALTALEREFARTAERRVPVAEEGARPAPPDASAERERDPAWYLEQYLASFAGGGEGSEYFRLAVEAFAPSLLREIGALVSDRRANATLRLRLVQMLGGARFRGDGTAIGVCLRLLPGRDDKALVEAALAVLASIGDPATARALENLAWSIESIANRWKAFETLVALSGSDANAALLRLWPRADDADRGFLIGLVSPGEGRHSLELFEQASYAARDVRLPAALAVGQFRFPGFAPFIDAWVGRERDEEVRAALGESRQALSEKPRWGAERACGPPDARAENDDPNAWASAQADMGQQWLELDYDPPLAANAVRIFEVCVPGAITTVVARDERGAPVELWSGVDPTTSPGVFALEFPATSFRVRTLRLTLDTNRARGWSEIDAVELIGPEGRAWASAARASSSYGR